MTTNNRNGITEREISMVDMLIDVLLHWRGIVIAIVLGGVFMGGVSYLRDMRNVQVQNVSTDDNSLEQFGEVYQQDIDITQINEQWLAEQLTEEEVNNVNRALLYRQLYEDALLYQQRSMATQVDPYNVPREEIILLVQSDDLNRTYSIKKIYEDMVTSAGIYEYLKENCGVDSSVCEMIILDDISYDQMYETDILRVTIQHYNEEICKKIADSVLVYLNEQSLAMQESLGTHVLSLVSRSSSKVFVEDYLTQQWEMQIQLSGYKTSCIDLKAKFTDKQLCYYNYMLSGRLSFESNEYLLDIDVQEENVEQVAEPMAPMVSKMYVVLGMALFAFIYVFVLLVLYVMDKRLRTSDNLLELYGIPQLGTIPKHEETMRRYNFIDRFVLSLRNRNKRQFTYDEAVELAAVSVKILAEREGIKEVTLVGCNLKDDSLEVCEQIKRRLEKDNVVTMILNNVLYDAQSMCELENACGVVLVETTGSTLYDEIAKEVELMRRQAIKIMGTVVVE